MNQLLDTGKIEFGCIHRKSDIIGEKEIDYVINSVAVNKGIETLIKLKPKNKEELFKYIRKISESGHYEDKNIQGFIETLLKLKILYRVFDVEDLKTTLSKEIEYIAINKLSDLEFCYSNWYDDGIEVCEYFMRTVESEASILYEVNEFFFDGFKCD